MRLLSITLHVAADPDPDTSYLDADHLALYHEGCLSYVGVYATAEVTIHGTSQTLHSGGLWELENWLISSEVDRAEEYIEDCLEEQRRELCALLRQMGCPDDAIHACPVTTEVH